MIADIQQNAAPRSATLSALQFRTPNVVPRLCMTIRLSGHGQGVALIATLGRLSGANSAAAQPN